MMKQNTIRVAWLFTTGGTIYLTNLKSPVIFIHCTSKLYFLPPAYESSYSCIFI